MATGRGYTVSSGLVAGTTATQTPIMFATAASTVSADIVGIRVSCPAGGTATTYPSGASVKFTLAKTTGGAGTASVTPRATNNIDIAANSLWYNGWSTAPTIGNVIWEHNLPFSAGSDWGELFAPGLERRLGGTGSADQLAVYVTPSSAGTLTDFEVGLDFIE
jgi:hypothetical protein